MATSEAPDIRETEALLRERLAYFTARNQADKPGRERYDAMVDALLQLLVEQAHRTTELELFVAEQADQIKALQTPVNP
jgi:hypothetical protein